MKALFINGRQSTHGELRLSGNKNAALPMIAAAVLTRETVVLHNLPEILDVQTMLAIASALGVQVKREGETVSLTAETLKRSDLPEELCRACRTSLLFAGPLAARLGEATLYPPGGDVIGRRRLDPHFYGLSKLGITAERQEGCFNFTRGQLAGTELFLDEPSVMATEHILMTAVLADGVTVLRNAACEPHVTQLAELLNAMGARIRGLETNLLVIEGVKELHGAEYTIGADHVNAASFLALAAATNGTVDLVGELRPHDFWMTRRVFERLGINILIEPGHLALEQPQSLRPRADFDGATPTISDGPWPQFPSDMMSCLIALSTQLNGNVLFFEKMFESRIYFVDRLIAMGANAVICDPHRVLITGPAELHGTEVISPDIRAGMAMVIAASVARGTSIIRNADMIYRGYANLPARLRQIGIIAEEREY